MEIKNTIPTVIWDAKKFGWKTYLKGKYDSLGGCPNWLYETIRRISASGQSQTDSIQIVEGGKYQYAIQFLNDDILIYSKKAR